MGFTITILATTLAFILLSTNCNASADDLLLRQISPFIGTSIATDQDSPTGDAATRAKARFNIAQIYWNSSSPFTADSLRPFIDLLVSDDDGAADTARAVLAQVFYSGERRLDHDLRYALEILLELGLWDTRPSIRRGAAYTVASFSPPIRLSNPGRAFERIRDMAQADPDPSVQEAARQALLSANGSFKELVDRIVP